MALDKLLCLSELCGKIALRELHPPLKAVECMQAANVCDRQAEKVCSQCSVKTKPARRSSSRLALRSDSSASTFPLLPEAALLQVPAEPAWAPCPHSLEQSRAGEGAPEPAFSWSFWPQPTLQIEWRLSLVAACCRVGQLLVQKNEK